MTIREITADERATLSFPIQKYAFWGADSPAPEFLPQYSAENLTLGAFDGDRALACATRIPMTQNVRDAVLPLAGIAGVASAPDARYGGRVRALVNGLHEASAAEFPVSALYPFRASFYERFGYASLPVHATATIDPRSLAPLLKADLGGEVTWHPIAEAFEEYRAFHAGRQQATHGHAMRRPVSAGHTRDHSGSWVALARAGGEVVGALLYTISGYHGELRGGPLVYRDPQARALLLAYLARHADQVQEIHVEVAPADRPELWLTDLVVTTAAKSTVTDVFAPMARVLNMTGLTGIEAGAGAVTVEVTGDDLVGGTWRLSADNGRLAVEKAAGQPEAVLTCHGVSALVYGSQDPAELPLKGYAEAMSPSAAAALRALLPQRTPWLVEHF
ncbi:GNAT family N-acetyltransferase [Longispora albida]|uniref:GNAT family N-acetyltransferase n=1 Tax=Longispora albida TaxID=203523 RepID=UPI00037A5E3D|nr:GNAT family N-acetyltransferase [Longispora albida]